jgi:HSP20 family protein
MNTLKIFTPSVFKTLSDNVFDHFLFNGENEAGYNNLYLSRPRTNIIEEDDRFSIEIALPGFTKEQINMKFHKDVLTVAANVEEEAQEGKRFVTREFGLRNFERRFTIPKSLEGDNIGAEFKNGILTIVVPKKVEAREKQPIEVQIN